MDACLLEKTAQIKAELATVISQLDSLFMEIENQRITTFNNDVSIQQNDHESNNIVENNNTQNENKNLHIKIEKCERRKLILERAIAVFEFKKERVLFTSKEEFMKNNFNIPLENYNILEPSKQQESSSMTTEQPRSELDLQYDSWVSIIIPLHHSSVYPLNNIFFLMFFICYVMQRCNFSVMQLRNVARLNLCLRISVLISNC